MALRDAAAAEKQARDMIVAGDIHATIDEQKGMVHFLERPEQYDSKGTLLAMEAGLQQAITLASKLHELHGSLSVDHNYQARATQERHQAQGGWDEESMMLSSK